MIQVLVAKANFPIIQENTFSKIKVSDETKNTMHFWISARAFQNLCSRLREKGFNPYAIMYF